MRRGTGLFVFVGVLVAVAIGLWLAPIKPVLLWTDLLIYILLFTLVSFFSYVRGKPHLVSPWRQVLSRPLAMISLVVLSAYVLVGLLDSVHFRMALAPQAVAQTAAENAEPPADAAAHYSVEVLSLLDVIANPIRRQVEKSYSAPLAAHLFSKDTVEQADGSTVRAYPRLQYGGAHLDDPESQRTADITQRALTAVAMGLTAWLLVVLLWIAYLARRQEHAFARQLSLIVTGNTVLPWRAIFSTLAMVFLFAALVIKLGVGYHLLGTDKVGNDVLYLSFKSIRTGLVIGTLTTLIMLPFAILLGIMAGHFRGWVDDVIQYVYTTLNSIPGVLLIAAAILSVDVYIANNPGLFETVIERADVRLLFLCMILGITSWTGLCRLLRGETLKLRELDYIQAATAFGVGNMKIISRHILPNVMHIVLIAVVLDFSGLVLAEAVLSYVGVGVDPSMVSWGNMINSARLEMAREPVVWWSLVAAFWFMFVLVLAANLFSDAVRDAFDPRVGLAN
ncbi:MAG: ABC transporter permease [Gammaproteobacteria bacterium]|nr:ABC transporter permease [Gammaproteobacteria bacterium]